MSYTPPLALTILSSISIGIAAVVALWILVDIILRRGWRTMMAVMIPVYIVNALYLWPLTLWAYLKYGRPSRPTGASKDAETDASAHHDHDHMQGSGGHHDDHTEAHDHDAAEKGGQHAHQHIAGEQQAHQHSAGEQHAHHHSSDRPMFATVTIGVCHCGAGCVLGDIVGEWLVYGTNAAIGNPPRLLWAEYLVDFAFAFAFGIVFQYFSIAPMSGDYGPKTILRALKADTLSLLFFEIGLFGWMAAFQIGIFQDQLEITTVTYWCMMQIGMFIGHWTGVPINYWLIKKNIKEPCA